MVSVYNCDIVTRNKISAISVTQFDLVDIRDKI